MFRLSSHAIIQHPSFTLYALMSSTSLLYVCCSHGGAALVNLLMMDLRKPYFTRCIAQRLNFSEKYAEVLADDSNVTVLVVLI